MNLDLIYEIWKISYIIIIFGWALVSVINDRF